MNTVRVQVPATSANCGPGFDCLGLALNLYNIFSFTPDVKATEYTYTLKVLAQTFYVLKILKKILLALQWIKFLLLRKNQSNMDILRLKLLIPPSRGLGSSSTAIVGGLFIS